MGRLCFCCKDYPGCGKHIQGSMEFILEKFFYIYWCTGSSAVGTGIGKTLRVLYVVSPCYRVDRRALQRPVLRPDACTPLMQGMAIVCLSVSPLPSPQIWDTAGQERYRTMTTMFYRGAQAGIIVFDITKRSSFEHLPNWLETLRKEVSENPDFQVPYIVIGNKLDIEELREVCTCCCVCACVRACMHALLLLSNAA